MKDSRVEWLGAIPKHWNLSRVKYYARCFNGSTPSTTNLDYWDNGTIPWLSSTKVNEEIVTQPSAYISIQALRECSLSIVPKGSVIVGIVGQGKTRGLSSCLAIDTTINQNMVAIIPSQKLEGAFLHFFIKQAYISIRNLGRGANQPALDVGLINRFPLVIPSISEQKKIVDYLTKQEQYFFKVSQKIIQAIERLKEYRTALITKAVTGKIDVRQVSLN
jgi:type I restriction enzyme S subunit